jgi:hypothetical protein
MGFLLIGPFRSRGRKLFIQEGKLVDEPQFFLPGDRTWLKDWAEASASLTMTRFRATGLSRKNRGCPMTLGLSGHNERLHLNRRNSRNELSCYLDECALSLYVVSSIDEIHPIGC